MSNIKLDAQNAQKVVDAYLQEPEYKEILADNVLTQDEIKPFVQSWTANGSAQDFLYRYLLSFFEQGDGNDGSKDLVGGAAAESVDLAKLKQVLVNDMVNYGGYVDANGNGTWDQGEAVSRTRASGDQDSEGVAAEAVRSAGAGAQVTQGPRGGTTIYEEDGSKTVIDPEGNKTYFDPEGEPLSSRYEGEPADNAAEPQPENDAAEPQPATTAAVTSQGTFETNLGAHYDAINPAPLHSKQEFIRDAVRWMEVNRGGVYNNENVSAFYGALKAYNGSDAENIASLHAQYGANGDLYVERAAPEGTA